MSETIPYQDTKQPTCPACGSQKTVLAVNAKDYLVSGEWFTIFQCMECTLRFTFPVPDEKQIAAYYQSENYISHTDIHTGAINKMYHLVRKYALKQKRKWVEKATGVHNGELLDIGCGTGSFLHEMKKSGWKVTGLEPDQQARDVARKQHQLSPLLPDELFHLPEGTFDAITLWHVLEHVHPLHEYLEQIARMLQPRGKVFIAVPNYTSADAKHYGNYWAAYDVPRHLYHFSPKALIQLAEQHHFRCTDQIVMPFDAFYISLMSEKYQKGKTHYLQGFYQGTRAWTYTKRDKSRSSSMLYVLDKHQ